MLTHAYAAATHKAEILSRTGKFGSRKEDFSFKLEFPSLQQRETVVPPSVSDNSRKEEGGGGGALTGIANFVHKMKKNICCEGLFCWENRLKREQLASEKWLRWNGLSGAH